MKHPSKNRLQERISQLESQLASWRKAYASALWRALTLQSCIEAVMTDAQLDTKPQILMGKTIREYLSKEPK